MIPFFRKIRKKMADDNKPIKYFRYAVGEIALVVIGILIALSINNWNEDRKLMVIERDMLKNLKVGMQGDINDIEDNIEGHNLGLKSQNIIIDWLENDLPYSDSLCSHFAGTNRFTVFVSDRSSFETLKIKGLNLISSDSLRDRISYLYESKYEIHTKRELVYNRLIEKMINEVNSKYFSAPYINLSDNNPSYIGCMHPNNSSHIKSSSEYLYLIKTIKEFNSLMIMTMEDTRTDLYELIEMIENELSF
jgi:hypothetical protein